MNHKPWEAVFESCRIDRHDFSQAPFLLTAEHIKRATAHFSATTEREVRVLCKQDTREDRPNIFREKDLFLLPIKNGTYIILQGDGYVDIPQINSRVEVYKSRLDFELDTSKAGNSEMQHLDFAYASSLIRSFLDDPTLVLTIRGRKYTPRFEFTAGKYRQKITVEGVQTEVDAGYEGKNQVVLIEAKNSYSSNTIIRQLYYPYRQWKSHTHKEVRLLFFEKRKSVYSLYNFEFTDIYNYDSIKLAGCKRYEIVQ
ncbi:MAG: hypothetical protein LBC67_03025 [Spirochaetales bacterium]|jgi:hypothetical protein|nr:hypothetical protein [Spirochaetales bacterium]